MGEEVQTVQADVVTWVGKRGEGISACLFSPYASHGGDYLTE